MYSIEAYMWTLQGYSLIQWRQGQYRCSMHTLVHTWGSDRLSLEQKRRFSLTALQLLLEAVSVKQSDLECGTRLPAQIIWKFYSYNSVSLCPSILSERKNIGALDVARAASQIVQEIGAELALARPKQDRSSQRLLIVCAYQTGVSWSCLELRLGTTRNFLRTFCNR